MSDAISFVPTSNTNTGSPSPNAGAALADNFDTFLTILTAQIQNQDPLEPMDSSKFTEQLVQFSGVEQQIKVNTQLETLIKATTSNAGASLSGYLGQTAEIDSAGAEFTGDAVTWRYTLPSDAAKTTSNAGASLSGYLGQTAEIDSAGAEFKGDALTWRYTLPSDAAKTTVTVTDASGKVVYSKTGELKAGSHDFEWDGQLNSGGAAAEGKPYWINVVAEDANAATIKPVHTLVTTITGVDLTYGEPALTTPAGVFAYSDIKRLMRQ